SVVELTLAGRTGTVRHELHLGSAGEADKAAPVRVAEQLTLQVDPAVASSLRVVKGGRLAGPPRPAGGGLQQVIRLNPPAPGSPAPPVLELRSPFAAEGQTGRAAGPLAVPLAVPVLAGGARGETRVRVWSEPGALPALSGPAAWAERSLEAVPGREDLP